MQEETLSALARAIDVAIGYGRGPFRGPFFEEPELLFEDPRHLFNDLLRKEGIETYELPASGFVGEGRNKPPRKLTPSGDRGVTLFEVASTRSGRIIHWPLPTNPHREAISVGLAKRIYQALRDELWNGQCYALVDAVRGVTNVTGRTCTWEQAEKLAPALFEDGWRYVFGKPGGGLDRPFGPSDIFSPHMGHRKGYFVGPRHLLGAWITSGEAVPIFTWADPQNHTCGLSASFPRGLVIERPDMIIEVSRNDEGKA